MTAPAEPSRPQFAYRERFRRLIAAESPRSVLEVGSGGGAMLRWLQGQGVAVEGVEVRSALVDKLRDRGHLVHQARAEELPFADDAFEIVASEYCAHHFADLNAALRQACRIAKRAVFLLDPWYDLTLASQRRMLRWDSWFKRIDRREGMVHNEVISADAFLAALPASSSHRVEFQHWLQLMPVDLGWFDAESAPHLVRATPAEAVELAAIRADAVAAGITDDGAIVVRIDVND